jgi:flagellar motor switch protein FliN
MTGATNQVASPSPLEAGSAIAKSKREDRLAAATALNDITLHLQVILGRTSIKARQLAALRKGDVFRLERPAGSKVDILLHPVRVAVGEIVPRNGKFAVRITSVQGKQPET